MWASEMVGSDGIQARCCHLRRRTLLCESWFHAYLCQGLEIPSPGSCFPVTIHCHMDDGETGYPPNMGSPIEDDGIPEGQRPTGSTYMLQITQARLP